MNIEKWILPTLVASQVISAQAEASLQSMMQAPLILGASVSADHSAMSPGKRLAMRFTTPDKILSRARGGRTGLETLSSVKDADFEGRSIVLAVDLFFWDSGLPNPKPSLAALEKLMKRVEALGIPIVLGEIPELLPGYQPSRVALNKAIHQACEKYAQCRVMPFDAMREELRRTGTILLNGKRRTLRELVPDGLHLGAEASECLADLMSALLAPPPKPAVN